EQRIEGQHVLPGEIRRAGKRKVRVAESRGAYDRSLVEIGSLRVRSQVDDMADARIAEPLDLARPNASCGDDPRLGGHRVGKLRYLLARPGLARGCCGG